MNVVVAAIVCSLQLKNIPIVVRNLSERPLCDQQSGDALGRLPMECRCRKRMTAKEIARCSRKNASTSFPQELVRRVEC